MFYRLYSLLEQASHELDLMMVRERSDCGQLGGSTFEHYSSLLQRMHKLQEEKKVQEQTAQILEQLIPLLALCVPTEASAAAQTNSTQEAIETCKKRTQELVNHKQTKKVF